MSDSNGEPICSLDDYAATHDVDVLLNSKRLPPPENPPRASEYIKHKSRNEENMYNCLFIGHPIYNYLLIILFMHKIP